MYKNTADWLRRRMRCFMPIREIADALRHWVDDGVESAINMISLMLIQDCAFAPKPQTPMPATMRKQIGYAASSAIIIELSFN